MRIHTENTENYIQALATSIGRDPASLENWRCLHIRRSDLLSVPWSSDVLATLKEVHTDLDCDIVRCPDGDVLLISRSLYADQLFELAHELLGEAMSHCKEGDIALYDLFHEWRTVRGVLLAKSAENPPAQVTLESHDFGEIAALEEVFAEARKLRPSRNPVHILLVEDDPLTRRVVSNAFRANYALMTAHTAQEAIGHYLLHAPDIVFLDVGLPDANGFSVLKQILKLDPEAYVVMFSGSSYLDNVTKALGAGAAGFIAKPFRREKMQHYIIDSALHHRRPEPRQEA